MDWVISTFPYGVGEIILDYVVCQGNHESVERLETMIEATSCLDEDTCRDRLLHYFPGYVSANAGNTNAGNTPGSWKLCYAYLLATLIYRQKVLLYRSEDETENYIYKPEYCWSGKDVVISETNVILLQRDEAYCPWSDEFKSAQTNWGIFCSHPDFRDIVVVTYPSTTKCFIVEGSYTEINQGTTDYTNDLSGFYPAYFDPISAYITPPNIYTTLCETTEFGLSLTRDDVQYHNDGAYIIFKLCYVRHALILEGDYDRIDDFITYTNSLMQTGSCTYIPSVQLEYGRYDATSSYIHHVFHVPLKFIVRCNINYRNRGDLIPNT